MRPHTSLTQPTFSSKHRQHDFLRIAERIDSELSIRITHPDARHQKTWRIPAVNDTITKTTSRFRVEIVLVAVDSTPPPNLGTDDDEGTTPARFLTD